MMAKGRHKPRTNLKGNNYAGKKILAEGKEYSSCSAAARELGISGNGVRKRIKLGWEGYALL
jgi:hypothetical protein